MKVLRLTLAFLVVSCVSTVLCAADFPTRPQEKFPSNMPDDIRKEAERLRSLNPVDRASAACSLGTMGARAVVAAPLLAAMLGDDTPIAPVHCKQGDQYNTEITSPGRLAAKALAEMGAPALNFLIAATSNNADWNTRKNAAWALGEVEYDSPTARARGLQALNAALVDPHSEVQESAAQALGELKDKSTVDLLTAALTNADWKVRRAAARALAEIKDRAAVGALTASLKDEHPEVREAAALALAEIRDRSAVGALAESLKDQDANVREAAATALGEIRDRAAVDALIGSLKDGKPEVRSAAAAALGEIRDNAAVTDLMESLNDENAEVRSQARRALAEIRGSRDQRR